MVKNELTAEEAVEFIHRFHGHIGPYVVLGYRAGLIANRELSPDPFSKTASTATGFKTPVSCFTDGVQIGSRCTLGKGNITVSDEGEASVKFSLKDGSKTVKIALTDAAKRRIVGARTWEDADKLGREMMEDPDVEIFEIEISLR